MRDERQGEEQPQAESASVVHSGSVAELMALRRRVAELEASESERRRVEEALRESEERYRSLVENAPDVIMIVDREGRILFINRTVPGLTVEGTVGTSVLDYVPAEHQDTIKGCMERVFETAEPAGYEIAGTGPHGVTSWYSTQVAPIQHDGQVLSVLLISRDMTERKQAEEALRESEERYRTLFEGVPVGLYRTTPEGQILAANPLAVQMLGYPDREALLTANAGDGYVNREDRGRWQAQMDREGVVRDFEVQWRRQDGTIVWVKDSARTVRDGEGRVLYYEGSLEDITERKRAEEALAQEQYLVNTLMVNVPDFIYFKDAGSRFTRINGALAARFGLSDPAQAIGKTDFDFFTEEHAEPAYGDEQEVMRSGQPLVGREEKETWPDGRETWVSTTKVPLRDDEGRIIGTFGISRDITEQKRAEEALRESKELLEKTFASQRDAILLLDAGIPPTILDCNPATTEVFGYTRSEMLGRTTALLHVDETGLREFQERLYPGVAERGFLHLPEFRMKRKDGTVFPTEHSVMPLEDDRGERMGWVSVVRDITEHKRMEERMRGQDRLAVVGQLAAGIAHDFNNILTGMIGFAELVHRRQDVPESVKADVRSIMEGGHRAAHLIRQILDFSRKSMIWLRPLDLASFLEETIQFLRRTIPERIQVRLQMGADDYWVEADAAQIQQLLTNLALNAQDAMPGGGELRLSLSRLSLGPGDGRPFASMEAGEWIALSISDTGTGIAPEVLAHLYEPFFTTKSPGAGTGLGLAQVYGIVKQHGGFIDVQTEVGRGTTFTVYLPPLTVRSEAPREEVAIEDAPGEALGGRGEVVLVVEDEPQVLRVSQALLEHLGYRVLTAAGGIEALEVYEERGEEIALVLADMVMPRMGGVELFQALRVCDPEVKMVVMTGYPLGRAEDRGLLEEGIVDWVLKPLDLSHLARVVRDALK